METHNFIRRFPFTIITHLRMAILARVTPIYPSGTGNQWPFFSRCRVSIEYMNRSIPAKTGLMDTIRLTLMTVTALREETDKEAFGCDGSPRGYHLVTKVHSPTVN